jgi:SAM-dependent methyltransferase
MCNGFCIDFIRSNLPADAVTGRRVLEVGAYNVNGSCRVSLSAYRPELYHGVDIRPGPDVDAVVDVYDLETHFGKESFNVVVNTEMLEHVSDWRGAINNMKNVVTVGGYLAITTRSVGFPYHGFPSDWWRFSIADMANIFSDYRIVALASDPMIPGVGLVAQKLRSEAKDLSGYDVYAMPQPS